MLKYVVITAGGTGVRMRSDIPKQFIELKGKPILMHSITRFYNYDKGINIIISLPEEHIDYWKDLCKIYKFNIEHDYVKGGETRFHSIKNALEKVGDSGLVAIHDGVRPLVNAKAIHRTFETAEKKGNAIASADIFFSLRKIENDYNFRLDRSKIKEIQTPQTFRCSLIKKAYQQGYDESFTDDASVIEKIGEKIYLVEGNSENIKITEQKDLIIAEALWDSIF